MLTRGKPPPSECHANEATVSASMTVLRRERVTICSPLPSCGPLVPDTDSGESVLMRQPAVRLMPSEEGTKQLVAFHVAKSGQANPVLQPGLRLPYSDG